MAQQGRGHNTLSSTDAARVDVLVDKRGNGGLSDAEKEELKTLKEKEIHTGS